ncbi:hypothetical protein CHUAL_003229 [Chamberlinius hualienensis]
MMDSKLVEDSQQPKILIGPLFSIFEVHGLTFKKDLSLYSSGKRRWIIALRCFLIIVNVASIAIAATILILHFTYNRGDIEALCMWLALHAMVLTSAVIYIRTLFRLSTMRNFIQAIDNLMNDVPLVSQCIKNENIADLHSMCHRTIIMSFTGQLLELIMLGIHMSFGNHKKIFYDDLASVYNLKHSRMHYWLYAVLSLMWDLFGQSFLRIYSALVEIICVALHNALDMLVESKYGISSAEFLTRHHRICMLIREADLLFSPFFFVKVTRSFITIVVFSRILKTLGSVWDSFFVIYIIGSSIVSFWINTSVASRLNEKVYTSLDPPTTVFYGENVLQVFNQFA